MNFRKELFAVKLCELDRQFETMQNRIYLCGQEDQDKIHQEVEKAMDESREHTLILRRNAEKSRSPAVKELSQAQLDYNERVRTLMKAGQCGQLLHPGQNGSPQDDAETAALFAEYAIDHAVDAMQYALTAALIAAELQISSDHQSKGAIQ